MKTNTSCKYYFVLLAFLISSSLFAQNKTLQKAYSWDFSVSNDANLAFNNYDCDLDIQTWDKPTIEYKLQITATGLKAEDIEILDNYLESLIFHRSSNHVTIDNRFWDQRSTRNNKTKMKLRNGEYIALTKFQISGELKIPSGTNLNLDSKYSNIEMDDIYGKLNLILYNDKLYAGNAGSNLSLEAKYSSIEFKTIKDIKAKLYSTDIDANIMGNLEADSKYSKIFCGTVKSIDINSYNDKLVFDTTGNVNFKAKYSSFIAKKSKILNVETYNCTVIIDKIESIKIDSKYSKFEFENGENCNISSAYNDGLKFSSLKILNIYESKYGTYKIDELSTSLSVTEGYNDKLDILKTGLGFKGLNVNEKYGKIKISLPNKLAFILKAKIKYPNLNIDEAGITIKIKTKENSYLVYEGMKGIESPEMPLIQIKGYSVSFSIINY